MQLMLVGRVLTDGRLNARVKCDLTENLSLKANSQVICNIVRGVSPPTPPLFTFYVCSAQFAL